MSEAEATDTAKRPREDEGETPAAEGATETGEPPAKVTKTEGDDAPASDKQEDPAAATTNGEPTTKEVKVEDAATTATPSATEGEAKVGDTAAAAPTPAATPAPAAAAATTSAPPVETVPPTGLPPGVPAPGTPAVPVAAAATPVYAGEAPAQMVEEKGEVSSMYVGRVIGKGGEMIRDLQARSGCRIDVDQSVPPGQPRIITYRGTRKTVDFAKQLVNMLCHEHVNEADLPLGEAKREIMAVPATSVGKIIGRGGEMIRELQSRSHAKIQVDHNNQGSAGLPSDQKRLTITGTEPSVVKAKEMVNFLVANPMMDAMQGLNMLVEDKTVRGGTWGSGPPYLNLPNMGQNMMPNQVGYGAPHGGGYDQGGYGAAPAYGQPPPAYGAPPAGYGAPPPQAMPYGAPPAAGGSEVEMFYAAKNFMGRIIGQKGVTINDLQRRSGCDIQINQDVPHGQDCEISIRGARAGIESAKQMLQEIISVGPNHPYAGGTPSHGGGAYGQQDPYGQQQGGYYAGAQAYGGYQQPQQPAYGQPYDQQQAYGGGYQQPAYGGAPAYGGMPQQPAYGGYPAAAPPQPPAAATWKSAQAADGQTYYYNEKTGETQWDKPAGMP